jgi:hypothetical protein
MPNWCLLTSFFLFIAVVRAQPTDPPEFRHNLSLERLQSKFKLSKQRYLERIDFKKIDTNAIYITRENANLNHKNSSYVFLRFFKDAVFESGSYMNPPTDEEAENLTYGSWRCYTFDKKTGMLVIEVPMPFMMSSSWMYHMGTISNDSLIFTHCSGGYPQYHSAPTPFHFRRNFLKRPIAFKNRDYKWMPATKEDL